MKHLISLKLNKEFKRAYFQGKFKAHPYLVTYLIKNNHSCQRIGITTGKKVGKAHLRNRARRVIRAAYVNCRDQISFCGGYDIVFVAREQTPFIKSTELEKVMKKQLEFLLTQKGTNSQRKNHKKGC